MRDLLKLIWWVVIGLFRSRASHEAEILTLRHQLNVLRRKSPKRLVFTNFDRLIFASLYRIAPNVLNALVIVKPETVIRLSFVVNFIPLAQCRESGDAPSHGDMLKLIWWVVIGLFRSRASLEAEIMALRHQLIVLRRKSPKQLAFSNFDRLVFASLYRIAPNVLNALVIVKPETVIRWHRAGFRLFWRWRS
jgi:hypothetical protein